MKIEKAIEILKDGQYHLALTLNPDFHKAVKLGIEALKRLKYLREPTRCVGFKPLPGEAEN